MTAEKFSSGKAAMVQMESTKISAWEKTQIYLNTLNHMFIATVSIYITWLSFQMGFHRTRTLHVWLCTLGVSHMSRCLICFCLEWFFFYMVFGAHSTCASYRARFVNFYCFFVYLVTF